MEGESRHGSEGSEEKAQEERRHGHAAMMKASKEQRIFLKFEEKIKMKHFQGFGVIIL